MRKHPRQSLPLSGCTTLKSSWYDDHFGWDASPREAVENRLGAFDRMWLTHDEEGLEPATIARFFDVFDPSGQG